MALGRILASNCCLLIAGPASPAPGSRSHAGRAEQRRGRLTIIFTSRSRSEYISVAGVEGRASAFRFQYHARSRRPFAVVIPNRKIVGEILHTTARSGSSTSPSCRLRHDLDAALATID